MQPMRPRGVAINYNFLQQQLFGNIPFIYLEILPEYWANGNDEFVYSTHNKLASYNDIVFISYFMATGVVVHNAVTWTTPITTLHITNRPSTTVCFLAFPASLVTTEVHSVLPAHFSFNVDWYIATVNLASNDQVFLCTVSDDTSAVYFYTELVDQQGVEPAHVNLYSDTIPDFNSTLRAYYIPAT